MLAISEGDPSGSSDLKALSLARILALVFLTLTLAVVLGGTLWVTRPQEAFSAPIQLRSGFSLKHRFRVPEQAVYRIEVRFMRLLPFERMKELLARGNLVEVRLLSNHGHVELHYFPSTLAPTVPSDLGFAKNWISQDMATFKGDPKVFYSIICSVIKPIDELNDTHPTLLVTFDSAELEAGAVGSLLLLVVVLILAALLVVFGIRFFNLRRRLEQT